MTPEEMIADLRWQLKAMTERAQSAEQSLFVVTTSLNDSRKQVERMRIQVCNITSIAHVMQRIAAGERE